MKARKTGTYEEVTAAGERVKAFLPAKLPPDAPPLQWDDKRQALLESAKQALQRLEIASEMVPSIEWFIYGFVRKEAVVSSRIEGTQATLVDLLSFEIQDIDPNAEPESSDDDVIEVCNYLRALEFAQDQMRAPQGLPLSLRLLNESHARLMAGARGAEKSPGSIRKSQNWVGGSHPAQAMFVPPPPHRLRELLSDVEAYMHADDELDPIIRAGLLHVQFETIHPYLDGNGRIGRLLVILLLQHWGQLSQPILYLSLYFHRYRDEYYERLNAVRTRGDWEGWIDYFLRGVVTIAEESASCARALNALVREDREKLLKHSSSTMMSARLFESLPAGPVIDVSTVTKRFDTSKPTATKAIEALVKVGILVESTGRRRNRSFRYDTYIEILRGDMGES